MYHHPVIIKPGGQYQIDIDFSVEQNLKSFKEEVLNRLYEIYKQHGEMQLLFSGGMDSSFILRSMKELGLQVNTLSLVPENYLDGELYRLIKSQGEKLGVKNYDFFPVTKTALFNHTEHALQERKIAYPMFHGFCIDYLLNTIKENKFLCGMGSEYKVSNGIIKLPFGPQLVKQNNPDRLYEFTTSRTFLSYVNHEQFILNYKSNDIITYEDGTSAEDKWYARDRIYLSCYPEMTRITKGGPAFGTELMEEFFKKFSWKIRKTVPFMPNYSGFLFDAKKYFNQKLLKENNVS